jgi:hypothetical protein
VNSSGSAVPGVRNRQSPTNNDLHSFWEDIHYFWLHLLYSRLHLHTFLDVLHYYLDVLSYEWLHTKYFWLHLLYFSEDMQYFRLHLLYSRLHLLCEWKVLPKKIQTGNGGPNSLQSRRNLNLREEGEGPISGERVRGRRGRRPSLGGMGSPDPQPRQARRVRPA